MKYLLCPAIAVEALNMATHLEAVRCAAWVRLSKLAAFKQVMETQIDAARFDLPRPKSANGKAVQDSRMSLGRAKK